MTWVLASALAAGITADWRVVVLALVFFLRLAPRREVSAVQGALLVVAAALFFGYGYVSIKGARRDAARVLVSSSRNEGTGELAGWVCGFPYWRYGGVAFGFRTRVDGIECTVLVQSKEFLASYGDSLRVRGTWKPRGDLPVERWITRCLATGYAGDFRARGGEIERLGGQGGKWISRRVLFPCHDRVRQELCRGLGSRSGIPIALLIGERGYLDRKANEAFRSLGISHLLALSGLHLGFVAGAFVLILRLIGKRGEIVLLAVLGVYVGAVGSIVSLYRAFAMAGVLIAASIVKRPLRPTTALAQAFVLVLLVHPHSYYSVAFQLSFLATFAVLWCVDGIRPPGSRTIAGRAAFWVRSSLQVSLAAQLFVTPLIIHYFGRVSLFSPLATLAFLWPVAFLLFASALAASVAIALPSAGAVAFWGLDRAATLFQKTLVASAGVLPGGVSPPAPDAWLYYAGCCVIMLGRGRWRSGIAGAALLVLSFVVDKLR